MYFVVSASTIWPDNRVAFLSGGRGGGNLVVFHYLGASAIWADKRVTFPKGSNVTVSASAIWADKRCNFLVGVA